MKEIKDFNGYVIYRNGRILSLPKKTRKKPMYLKPVVYNNGYCYVDLIKDGKSYKRAVHRLVAESFKKNYRNKEQVNHKNGIKTDNRVENLEWATRSENQKHAIRTGLRTCKGEKNSQSKLNKSQVLNIREYIKDGYKTGELSVMFKISASTICDIKYRRSWNHI